MILPHRNSDNPIQGPASIFTHRSGRSSFGLESRSLRPSSPSADRHGAATLALGGGGARGVAHFGAMQAVREVGISIARIVGTSIGSLAGSMVAVSNDVELSAQKVVEYVTSTRFQSKQNSLCGAHPKSDPSGQTGMLGWYDQIKTFLWARRLMSRVFRKQSLLSANIMEEVISELVPDIDIQDTTIPLSIVTVDLKSGHQIILEKGPLRKAILASTAIPGIFPPVQWDDMMLCDYGVLDSLPTAVAKSYRSAAVIAVDVGPETEPVDDCESALHVLLRMDEISERLCRRHSHRLADVLIQPNVGGFQWFDFSQPQALITSGLDAGRTALSLAYSRFEAV